MAGPADTDAGDAWSWWRIARIAGLGLALLAGVDLALIPLERDVDARAERGALRNTRGIGNSDASRRMLLDTDPDTLRRSLVFVGSSVTYGSGVDADQAFTAIVAQQLAERRIPVFNTSQSGGLPRTPIPVAAALGTRPARLLLVEVLVPAYAERSQNPEPAFSTDQVAMLMACSPAGCPLVAEAGFAPDFAERVEARLAGIGRRLWRAYRIRGRLWIDDDFMPNLLFWSLRRWAAELRWLPKRFQGQTTNVGKLPWREAYGTRRPGSNQRLRVPTGRVAERYVAPLLWTQRLADVAGVPAVFYEVPVNLEFQRHFGLMDEAAIARLAAVREQLFARMRGAGLALVEAPELPDDVFLDKAHLTPRGHRLMARHLLPAIQARVGDGAGPR